MARRVIIDTDECIGCESCVELCSEVFAFNEDEEKAEVILPEGGPEDCIEEAMGSCPVECIHWEEDQKYINPLYIKGGAKNGAAFFIKTIASVRLAQMVDITTF